MQIISLSDGLDILESWAISEGCAGGIVGLTRAECLADKCVKCLVMELLPELKKVAAKPKAEHMGPNLRAADIINQKMKNDRTNGNN